MAEWSAVLCLILFIGIVTVIASSAVSTRMRIGFNEVKQEIHHLGEAQSAERQEAREFHAALLTKTDDTLAELRRVRERGPSGLPV